VQQQQKRQLAVTYLNDAGIKVKIKIDVSSFTLEDVPGGGCLKWRNEDARGAPRESQPGGNRAGRRVTTTRRGGHPQGDPRVARP